KNIGLKIDLINKHACPPACSKTSLLATGDFDIGEFAEAPSYDPDDHTLWVSTQTPDQGGSNYMHYSNPEVDQQEQIQQGTNDVNARKAAFHIIHADILKDVPNMFLYSTANIFCWNNNLQNYNPSPFAAAETWNVWEWALAQ